MKIRDKGKQIKFQMQSTKVVISTTMITRRIKIFNFRYNVTDPHTTNKNN